MTGVFDGLVIRECDYGENDKLLTVLTAEYGQCLIIAKGARSIKSKLMPLCRLFTYANFEFYQRSGRRWLSGGEILNNFYKINTDIQSFALTAYILSLASEISGEGVAAESTLRMTLNTLYAIENKLKPLSQIKAVYEIFCAEESGFSPDISGCEECGCEVCDKGFWLDVMNGAVICADCKAKKNIPQTDASAYDELMTSRIILPLDNNALVAWRYVTEVPMKRVFAFSLTSEESLMLLSKAAEKYILNHLERGFETLDFYNTVKDIK